MRGLRSDMRWSRTRKLLGFPQLLKCGPNRCCCACGDAHILLLEGQSRHREFDAGKMRPIESRRIESSSLVGPIRGFLWERPEDSASHWSTVKRFDNTKPEVSVDAKRPAVHQVLFPCFPS